MKSLPTEDGGELMLAEDYACYEGPCNGIDFDFPTPGEALRRTFDKPIPNPIKVVEGEVSVDVRVTRNGDQLTVDCPNARIMNGGKLGRKHADLAILVCQRETATKCTETGELVDPPCKMGHAPWLHDVRVHKPCTGPWTETGDPGIYSATLLPAPPKEEA